MHNQRTSSLLYLVTQPHKQWHKQVQSLILQGVSWVQIREKGISVTELKQKTEAVLTFVEQHGLPTTVLLNDNVEVAREFGIGVHLGQHDMLPAHAREILGPDVPIGWTIHDDVDLVETQQQYIQYVGVGPMFPTTTKLDTKSQLSIARLREVCLQCPVSVVAIGGINAANIHAVRQADPWAIAMSSALMNASSLVPFLRHQM